MADDLGLKMSKLTAQLRKAVPGSENLRLRRGRTAAGERVWQLIGYLPDGSSIARRMPDARNELEALESGKLLARELLELGAVPGRPSLSGSWARLERGAMARVEARRVNRAGAMEPLRPATIDYHHSAIQLVAGWATDRGLSPSQAVLLAAIRATDQRSRVRRKAIEGALALAEAAGLTLEVPAADLYAEPPPPKRVETSDDELLALLHRAALRLNPAAWWPLFCSAVTGCRGNGCASMQFPEGYGLGARVVYFCSKRSRPAQGLIAVPWAEKLAIERPEWWAGRGQAPLDRPMVDDQLRSITLAVDEVRQALKRAVGAPVARLLSFRQLRHLQVLRLQRKGIPLPVVAELLATSPEQIKATYGALFSSEAADIARRFL